MENGSLFFIRALEEHFAAAGKRLSARVKEILAGSPMDFNQEEKDDYHRLIKPARELVKQSLREELKRADGAKQTWMINCLSCTQTVVGSMAAEVLLEQEAAQQELPGLMPPPEPRLWTGLREDELSREIEPGQLSLESASVTVANVSHSEADPVPSTALPEASTIPSKLGDQTPVGRGGDRVVSGDAEEVHKKLQTTWKKALKALEWAATLLISLLVLMAAFLMVAPRFGLKLHPVLSGSMEPALKVGGLVFCRSVPVAEIREGDIIGFNAPDGGKVTHRVIAMKEEEGKLWFQTKGDANEDPDPDLVSISGEWVDKVVYHLPYLGYLSSFMQTRLAFLFLICGPAAILIFLFGRDIWTAAAEMRKEKRIPGIKEVDD